MRNLNLIIEESFPVHEKDWLKEFFPDDCLNPKWYAYCIYTEKNNAVNLIWGSLSPYRLQGRPGYSFVDHLTKYNPDEFMELVFHLDIYTACLLKEFEQYVFLKDIDTIIGKFCQIESSLSKPVEALLKDSRGVVLWHYQLENLLNLFMMDRGDVLSIRKDINAKRAEVFDRVMRFRIDGSLTLMDFIMNRMYLGHTVYPNIRGAYLLYNLFKQDPQQIEQF